MVKLICAIILLLFILPAKVKAQDELMTWQEKRVTNFELKILRVNTDTLFYRSFFRDKYYLKQDLIGYRYKDSNWVYFSDTVPEKIKETNRLAMTKPGKPGELYLVDNGAAQLKRVSIVEIRNDSVICDGLVKEKKFSFKELIAYRYKNDKWNFVNFSYRDNIRAHADTACIEFKNRRAVLLNHAITAKRFNKVVNAYNNYAIDFYGDEVNVESRKLTKGRCVSFRLKTDTLAALYVLPLSKIYKDTLYFDKNYYAWDAYVSINIQDLSYICFDNQFPLTQIPLEERKKQEAKLNLIQMAYESNKGFWLISADQEKTVRFKSVDVGY